MIVRRGAYTRRLGSLCFHFVPASPSDLLRLLGWEISSEDVFFLLADLIPAVSFTSLSLASSLGVFGGVGSFDVPTTASVLMRALCLAFITLTPGDAIGVLMISVVTIARFVTC